MLVSAGEDYGALKIWCCCRLTRQRAFLPSKDLPNTEGWKAGDPVHGIPKSHYHQTMPASMRSSVWNVLRRGSIWPDGDMKCWYGGSIIGSWISYLVRIVCQPCPNTWKKPMRYLHSQLPLVRNILCLSISMYYILRFQRHLALVYM